MSVSSSAVPRFAGGPGAYRELLGPDVESLSPVKRALNLVVVFVGHLVDSRLLGDRNHVDDIHCDKSASACDPSHGLCHLLWLDAISSFCP